MTNREALERKDEMSDRDAFLRAIADNPEDTTARGAFADWLDEHGEPDEAKEIRKSLTPAAQKLAEKRRLAYHRAMAHNVKVLKEIIRARMAEANETK